MNFTYKKCSKRPLNVDIARLDVIRKIFAIKFGKFQGRSISLYLSTNVFFQIVRLNNTLGS